MPSRVANCPNCGGQVEFKAGHSLLSVCPYCASAVARLGDDIGELEILGQVAPVTDLGSPLQIGSQGRYKKKGFVLVGQLQMDHGAGPWNEWYAAFDDGTWGWVAEAQGRAYITFGREVAGLPDFRAAKVSTRFPLGGHTWVVVERRRATFVAATGELPFAIAPGSHFHYADVQGPEGAFGTIDYGTGTTPEALFLGEELPYEALFDKATLRNVEPGQAAAAAALNCPNCGSGIELRAPDDAMRVTCETCGSFLDCADGELSLLRAAKRPGPEPTIPLGSVGKFDDIKWTVHGHLWRSFSYEGVQYTWEEYLLHGGVKNGYRWLSCSDGHWTWVDPVHAGSVVPEGQRGAKLGTESFRHFQSASAKVESLRGEFYWKVAIGERAATHDYIKPPKVLSREVAAEEVNWSLGTYLSPEQVQEAFKLKDSLPDPVGVAPHQPNVHAGPLKGMLGLGGLFSLLLLALSLGMSFTSDNKVVLDQKWPLVAPKDAADQGKRNRRVVGARVQSDKFTLSGHSNLAVRLTSDVKNAWLFFNAELVNLGTEQVTPFGVQVSYSSGYAGGSSWAQGGKTKVVFLGDLPEGIYVIRAFPEWGVDGPPPTRMTIQAREDVFIGSHAMVVFFLIWILPLFKAIQYYSFEKRRWAESDHAG